MSAFATSCPSCGAPLAFGLGSSLLKICEQCGVAVARKGADLASYGRVAEPLATASVLKLGIHGRYEGAPPFHLVGRLQLDYGEGTWDEWLLGFDNGSWAWLSESQGKFHYMASAAVPPVPAFEDLSVDQTLDLGPPGTFVVTEIRTARFMTAQGELPFDVAPGSLLNYADLSGPGGLFATLDYGTGSQAEALYVGREESLDQLGIKERAEAPASRRAEGKSLSCPQCGGPLEIRVPDLTKRVACPYCGSLLDATKDLAVLEALSSVPVTPLIPLGARGHLGKATWTVVGFMERSTTVEGTRYPWHEYLLHEPRLGFQWLVESNGHWTVVEPVAAGDIERSLNSAKDPYRTYRHFQSGTATVDHVLGEFYWAVARGNEVETADYVNPPYSLSEESTRRGGSGRGAAETTWSRGTYQEPTEIWAAFGQKGVPPAPEGVAMNQPWAHQEASRTIKRLAFLFAGLVVLLYMGLSARQRTVHEQSVRFSTTAVSGAPESATFTEPFVLPSSGNLEILVTAPVDNSWLYLDGALINEDTGAVDEFDTELSYYYGYDDGQWTEGSRKSQTHLGRVPAGRYTMRLAPQWENGKMPDGYSLTVRSGVPRFSYAFLAILAILAWPLAAAWRHLRFEYRRWSESDHPWVTQE